MVKYFSTVTQNMYDSEELAFAEERRAAKHESTKIIETILSDYFDTLRNCYNDDLEELRDHYSEAIQTVLDAMRSIEKKQCSKDTEEHKEKSRFKVVLHKTRR